MKKPTVFKPLAPPVGKTLSAMSILELKAAVFDDLRRMEEAALTIIEPAKKRIQLANAELQKKEQAEVAP